MAEFSGSSNELPILQWLVEHHIDRNLEKKCLPYLGNGMIMSPANHRMPVREGKENQEYKGILILRNGDTLKGNLVRDGFLKDYDIEDKSYPIATKGQFFRFLDDESRNEDGVYIVDSGRKELSRVCWINYPSVSREGLLPLDFVFYNGHKGENAERDMWLELGSKTRLGVALPRLYEDVEAFMLKRSGYTPLGMGKAVRFGDGLEEEVFFQYLNPDNSGSISDYIPNIESFPEGIIGIKRSYLRENGELIRQSPSQVVYFNEISELGAILNNDFGQAYSRNGCYPCYGPMP